MDTRFFFRFFSCGLTVLSALHSGCGGDGPDRARAPEEAPAESLRDQGKRVFARPTWTTASVGDQASQTPPSDPRFPVAGDTTPSNVDVQERSTWAILLGVASGQGADRQAATLAALASKEAGLKDVTVERRGEGFAAIAGAYDEPGSAEAKRDLAKAREFTYQGGKPFEAAIMAAPAKRGAAGSQPEHDLRNARQFAGGARATKTLQVGIYGRTDYRKASADEIAEFRAAAEKAVRAIRAEGLPAFYYHGPERSTVTIGLFESGDDPRIAQYRKLYPHNMVNGQKTTTAKASERNIDVAQPSFIVGIPK